MTDVEIRTRFRALPRDMITQYVGLYTWIVHAAPEAWRRPLLLALDRLVTLNPPLSDRLRVPVGTFSLLGGGRIEVCIARLLETGGRAGLLLRRGQREWSLPNPDQWGGLVETGAQLVPAPEPKDQN
jgi:hypothetical protein